MDDAVRRVVLFAGLVAAGTIAAISAGTGGGSDAEPTVPSSSMAPSTVPATIAPSTTEPPAPTTTATVDALAVERAVVDGLPERSDDAVIADTAATPDGPAVVVGRIENSATGSVRPYAMSSRNGRNWTLVDLPLGSYGGGQAAATGAAPGGAIVAGTVRAADGTSAAASWVRVGRRWSGPFPTGTSGASSASVTDVAAGSAGAVLLAREGDTRAAWLSADGRLWNEAPAAWDAARDAIAVAVGDVAVMLVQGNDDGVIDAGVLVGHIGGPLERIAQPFGPPGRAVVADLVATADGFVAVGGVSSVPGGDYEPAVWKSVDGRSWQRVRGAVPPLNDGTSSRGTLLDHVDAGPAGIVVAADSGQVWRSTDGRRFTPLPDDVRASRLAAVVALRAPVIGSTSRLLTLDGDRWIEPARRLLPVSELSAVLNGVTHMDGVWYAVGAQSRTGARDADGVVTRGVVWRSVDGRRWRRLPDDAALSELALTSVTGVDGGLVAVGTGTDGDKDAAGQVLRRTGRRWRAVPSPELEADGGTRQLESVAPGANQTAVATGIGFDGVDIRPLVLRVGANDVIRRASRGLEDDAGDVVTRAACASGGTSLVVGQVQGATLAGRGWTSRNLRRWTPLPLDPLNRADACAGTDDGRFAVAGQDFTASGARAAAVAGRPEHLAAIAFDDDGRGQPNGVAMSNDVVVIVGEHEGDGVVWIGDDRTVRRVEVADLTGPGSQAIRAVAIADGRAVLVGSALGQGAIWVAELP